jgi:hypothetical protein
MFKLTQSQYLQHIPHLNILIIFDNKKEYHGFALDYIHEQLSIADMSRNVQTTLYAAPLLLD